MHTGTITPESRIPAAERPRLGILYPRGGSAFEYYRFAEHFCDNIRCYLIGGMHAFGGDRTHYPDPLRAIGAIENLRYPTRSMRPLAVHSGMWSSTSASFIGGMQWSLDQAAALSDILGAPVSSTSLAFVGALRALGVDRVAVLASYPREVTRAFRRFLGEADIFVSDFVHLDTDRARMPSTSRPTSSSSGPGPSTMATRGHCSCPIPPWPRSMSCAGSSRCSVSRS